MQSAASVLERLLPRRLTRSRTSASGAQRPPRLILRFAVSTAGLLAIYGAVIIAGIFTFLIALGALIAMMPGLPLIRVLIITQVINGLLLPVILVAVLRLVNNRELMGSHVNGPLYNLAAWLTTFVVSGLSVLLIAATLFPNLFAK